MITPESGLSIDMDLIRKNAYLPVKLAELSHINPTLTLELLRHWGACTKKIDVLWDEAVQALNEGNVKTH
jgi:hypothetical protein